VELRETNRTIEALLDDLEILREMNRSLVRECGLTTNSRPPGSGDGCYRTVSSMAPSVIECPAMPVHHSSLVSNLLAVLRLVQWLRYASPISASCRPGCPGHRGDRAAFVVDRGAGPYSQ